MPFLVVDTKFKFNDFMHGYPDKGAWINGAWINIRHNKHS
jgi:hypothetical protein